MLRRLITLLFVALLSGTAGTAAGILIAPAAGLETRERLSVLVEKHGEIVQNGVQWSRQLLGNVTGFISSQWFPPDEN